MCSFQFNMWKPSYDDNAHELSTSKEIYKRNIILGHVHMSIGKSVSSMKENFK